MSIYAKTLQFEVLQHEANSFRNEKGELIEFYQAVLRETSTGQLSVANHRQDEVFDQAKPGKVVALDVSQSGRKNLNLPAIKIHGFAK